MNSEGKYKPLTLTLVEYRSGNKQKKIYIKKIICNQF